MMRTLICYVAADFQKTKRMPIRKAHFFIPVGIAGIFLIYYTYSSWNAYSQIAAYFQILGIGFPFLIGLFCALISGQEWEAGAFREMLGAPKKIYAFFSKLILLLLFGWFSVFLASCLFGAGYTGLLQRRCVGFFFYIKSALILCGSSVVLYTWHLFLSFHYNKESSIGMGIMESLLSALLLTGMGDGIWLYIPAAWAPRLINGLLTVERMQSLTEGDFHIAVTCCFIMTAAALAGFGIWAHGWEGTDCK